MKELLKTIILDQQQLKWSETLVRRSFPENMLKTPDIIVISGIRRCGKSTLLNQIRDANTEKDYYFNFDDERLVNFNVDHFQILQGLFIELFGEQKVYYFDEIQNVSGWERFIRRLHDYGNKIFLTGSNATMLSRELGTHLTGRYLRYELFPFSFAEYLKLQEPGINTENPDSTKGKANISKYFSDYFLSGGFPQYIRTRNDLYLKSLYESILYRDVMVRNNLTRENELTTLVNYLAGNVSKSISYNNLTGITGVKNPTTIKKYIDLLCESYLVFQVSKYDYSISKQIKNPKKIYFIDHALVGRLGFQFSDNKGRLLENIVFIDLCRRGKSIWYHTGKHECDFLIKEGNKITGAIQVCWSLSDQKVRKRELEGLKEAIKTYDLKTGLIITRDENEEISLDGIPVRIAGIANWMNHVF